MGRIVGWTRRGPHGTWPRRMLLTVQGAPCLPRRLLADADDREVLIDIVCTCRSALGVHDVVAMRRARCKQGDGECAGDPLDVHPSLKAELHLLTKPDRSRQKVPVAVTDGRSALSLCQGVNDVGGIVATAIPAAQ